jgi:hypothetical protein
MARIGSAPPTFRGEPVRRRRAVAPLLLVLAVPGCQTLERMDYLDRFFDPTYQQRVVVAAEPPPEPALAPDHWRTQPNSVMAMESRPGPPSPSAADWGGAPSGSVVAMEPRPNPPPAAAAAEGSGQSERVRAAEPRVAGAAPQAAADPEARTRSLVRQNPWLTQFWMELTPAQQARVERQLSRGDVVLAAERTEPAAAWDAMGLADRARLIFGPGGQPFERPAPPERRDGSIWARNS